MPSSRKHRSPPRTAVKALPAKGQTRPSISDAIDLQQAGDFGAARPLYQALIREQPGHWLASYLLGTLEAQCGNHALAVGLFSQALARKPDNADLLGRRGFSLHAIGQLAAALADYDAALRMQPDTATLHFNRAITLEALEQPAAAALSYHTATVLKPDFAQAFNNLGNLRRSLGQHAAAQADFEQAIRIQPDNANAHYNHGLALFEQRQFEAAAASLERFSQQVPGHPEAHYYRGIALLNLGQYAPAVDCFNLMVRARPEHLQAWQGRGRSLRHLNQLDAAVANYEVALQYLPDALELSVALVHLNLQMCDWTALAERRTHILSAIQRDEPIASTLTLLALTPALDLQSRAARRWVQANHPANGALGPPPRRDQPSRLRIGYFSADFNQHPVALLTAGLFESHDKTQFETFAFSYGLDKDQMTERLVPAFDQFIECRSRSDQEIAEAARALDIDIAVDLGGQTLDARLGIFSYRAAPIQVTYLGFPGTVGADYIDYLIGDRQLIPEAQAEKYAEKIVYLPSFQANDDSKTIADRVFTRQELGLPDDAFVFCCFNSSYKLSPELFDSWMSILERVEGSVLWLVVDNIRAAENLLQAAARRQIRTERIVFATKMRLPDYLARYRMADLFLDTLPFNAGTTASDALWAGLPVLTCAGEAFASRMGASLLTAVGLPELITTTLSAYEAAAIELATHPTRLKTIRATLNHDLRSTALFNTRTFTRHLEAAYRAMYDRYDGGLAPDHIHIG